MQTTYFVSGYMRCGTSMMMRALEAGGLNAAYSARRDGMNQQFGDEHYKPNPGGFYELEAEDYRVPDFPRAFEGRLVKCLFGGITRIVAGNYRIIFMRRDFEEIRQSYEGFFSTKCGIQDEKTFLQRMEAAIGILRQRRDVEVWEIWYRDVVKDPLRVFKSLKDQGWPIDPLKAAAIVDPELCRFRREELEIGI